MFYVGAKYLLLKEGHIEMKNTEDRREMLATAPVMPLLIKMSLPAMIGMLVLASYNVVDGIYIGWGVGPLGIAATSVAYPFQMFVNALALWIGIGTASLTSRELGAGEDEHAERALANGFAMSVAVGLFSMAMGLAFMGQLVGLMGADASITAYAEEYLAVVFLGTPLVTVGMLFNSAIRAEGNTKYAMYSMVIPAVLNVFLDPLFIFVFKLGMAGAAIATVTGQFVTLLWVLRYYLGGKLSLVRLDFSKLALRAFAVREIITVGASEFCRSAALTFCNAVLMHQISAYGSPAHIAAFSISMKVSSLGVMPLFGLGQGLQPIIGYCYGARLYDRAREAVEKALLLATTITVIGEILIQAFPQVFAKAFTADPDVIRLTVWSVRIIKSLFAILGFQIVGTVVFQALGFAAPALFLSLSRQVIFFIPALLVLPHFFGVAGVFLTYPVSDFAACAMTLVLLLSYRKRFRALESAIHNP